MSKAKRVDIFVIVVCSLMGGVGNVLAAYDGNDLLGDCQIQDDKAAGFCAGYVRGALETALGIWDDPYYCLPEGVKAGQAVRIVVKYLEQNPAELHYNAASLVQRAFIEAFPCTEGE